MSTIGVGLIVKNEERDLPIALESIACFADMIVIVDTGSTDNTEQEIQKFCVTHNHWFCINGKPSDPHPKALKKLFYFTYLKANNPETGLLENFSKARNQYIEALEPYVDWLFSLDADDKVTQPEKVKSLTATETVYSFQILDSVEDTHINFPQERLWPSKFKIRFEGWCHECLDTARYAKTKSGIAIIHNWTPHSTVEGSAERNLRILKKEYDSGKYTLRTVFYLGDTYSNFSRYDDSLKMWNEYLAGNSGNHEETVWAHIFKARALRFHSKYHDSIAAAHIGLTVDTRFSEMFMEAARSAYQLGYHEVAIGYCKHALQPMPDTNLFQERNEYTDQPHRLMSYCYEALGNIPAAIEETKLVISMVPPDADMQLRLTNLMQIQNPQGQRREVHILRPGAAGDVLCALSAIQRYVMMDSKARIIFHTNGMYADLARRCPAVDEVRDDTPASCISLMGYNEKPLKKHIIYYFMDELGIDYGREPILPLQLDLPPPMKKDLKKYLTLHITPGWSPYKAWFAGHWYKLLEKLLKQGVDVIQIGTDKERWIHNALNWLGETTLVEAISLVANAECHIGVDSVFSHATNVNKATPGVILFGSTSPMGHGYPKNTNIWKEFPCSPCYKDYPVLTGAPVDPCPHVTTPDPWVNPDHPCMIGITVDEVYEAVANAIAQKT